MLTSTENALNIYKYRGKSTTQKMKFSTKYLFTFTEKTINQKLHFLCSEAITMTMLIIIAIIITTTAKTITIIIIIKIVIKIP